MIQPLKIRLSNFEVKVIVMIMDEASKMQIRPDMRNETILLSENLISWAKKYLASSPIKPKTYTMAISLARILHIRLQQIPTTLAHQTLLAKLDQELTNINLQPPIPKPLL